MSEEYINEIYDIWKELYQLSDKDKEVLKIPARGKFDGVTYGIYCGPFTNQIYSIGYESNKTYGTPIDSLDFICYLHDKFFTNLIADDCMIRSINVLNDNMMIGSSVNIKGTRNLLTIMRKAFNIWRHVSN